MTQAALGTTVSVAGPGGTVDGRDPGRNPARRGSGPRGQGMPVLEGRRRGNFHVHARVHVPRRLDDSQRTLLEQLGRDARRRPVPPTTSTAASSAASRTPSAEVGVKRQSAVFVAVPVGRPRRDFRARHHPRAIARKLPPHITIVPPFTRDVDDGRGPGGRARGALLRLRGVRGRARRRREVPASRLARARARTSGSSTCSPSTRDRFPNLVRDERPRAGAPSDDRRDRQGRVDADGLRGSRSRSSAPLLPLPFDVRDVGLFEVRREGWHEVRRFALG